MNTSWISLQLFRLSLVKLFEEHKMPGKYSLQFMFLPLLVQVFTALALVGMLILPLNSFPWVLNGTLEAKVSLDRIQRFLELEDQDLEAYYALGNGAGCCWAWGSGQEVFGAENIPLHQT